jgi:beta-glucanase (GH16 family)
MISKEKYLSDMKSAKFYLHLAFPYELYNSVNWLYISVICYIVQSDSYAFSRTVIFTISYTVKSDSYTVKWFSLQFSQTVIPLMYILIFFLKK